jgi:rRNA maturation RNase YbeY
MIVHGMLHLLGYNHEESVDARKMRRREKAVIALIKPEKIDE